MDNNPLKIFEPNRDEFDLEWIDCWEQDGFPLKSFRITTNVIDGKPIRTYGVVGFPGETGVLPAILHVHGGGQTASVENIVYHLKRGYVCMSFDWTGTTEGRDEDKVTQYPKQFHENDSQIYDDPDIANIKIACAVKAARCCLAFLASFDNVDADNIGFYGISWGGFATWLINGTDSTAKCAVAVYGTGGLQQPGHLFNSYWLKATDRQKKNWMTVIEPRNYINSQHAPILHVNGTNDFFGGFDTAADMLPMINSDWRCDYTPNCNHHFDAGSDRLMDYWFDHYLKGKAPIPQAPEIIVEKKDDETIVVTTEAVPDNYMLYYSSGSASHFARSWSHKNNWQKNDKGYCIELEAVGDVWLFVRETFENGMTLSSTPLCMYHADFPIQTSDLLFEPGNRTGGWGKAMGTELFHGRIPLFEMQDDCLEIVSEDDSFSGLVFWGMSDPVCLASRDCKAINIQLDGIESLTLVGLDADISKRDKSYTATIDAITESTIRISKDQFKHPDKEELDSFADIMAIQISGRKRKQETGKIFKICWDRNDPNNG